MKDDNLFSWIMQWEWWTKEILVRLWEKIIFWILLIDRIYFEGEKSIVFQNTMFSKKLALLLRRSRVMSIIYLFHQWNKQKLKLLIETLTFYVNYSKLKPYIVTLVTKQYLATQEAIYGVEKYSSPHFRMVVHIHSAWNCI